MKKLFISGGTGFIGENLINKLSEKNYEIYALCRNVTDRKITLPKDINIILGDLIDPYFIHKTIHSIKPDIIVHLASYSSVYYSHEHAWENVMVTYGGTINLQKASEGISNLEKFIFASTSEVYGNQDSFPIRETAELRPNNPYSIAKAAAEWYLHYCKETSEFPAIIMRPHNSYGREKNLTFVTENIIWQMLTKDKIMLGDPTPIRDLMYVTDHVNGYIKAIETKEDLSNCRAINLCTGIGVSIKELAEKIAKITNFKGEISWNCHKRPTEIYKLIGDWGLAFNKLGWCPETTLDEGLILTKRKIMEVLGLS